MLRRAVPALGLCLVGAFAAIGCAKGETAQDKQLTEMRDTITRMQEDRDRFDQRLGALEVQMADDKQPPVPDPTNGKKGSQPQRTVQLGSDDSHESDDPNDTSNARPEIKVQGAGGPSRAGVRMPDSPSNAARSSALDPDAKKTYERGLSEVQGKQPDKGLDTLASFLVKWPDHPYAANAMYWRGEAYYAKSDYLKAAEQFEGVITRFGGSAKAPDALLKIGMCHDKLGAPQRAQEYWDRLRTEYPRSDAAKKIPTPARDDRKGPKENR